MLRSQPGLADATAANRTGLSALVITALVVVVAGLLPSIYMGREQVRQLSPYHWQLQLALHRADMITTAAIGDSHTGLGFHPPLAKAAFNLGWPDSLLDLQARTEWILTKLPKLREVALQLQPHMFFPHRVREQLTPLSRSLSQQTTAWHPLASALPQFGLCCRAAIAEGHWRRWTGTENPANPVVLDNGYLRYSYSSDKTLAEQARLEVASYGERRFVPELVRRYEKLVETLVSQGYAVVLTRYPLAAQYRTELGDEAFKATEAIEQSLRTRFPSLKSCGRWSWEDPGASFLNSDHLDQEGAKSYWRVLAPCLDHTYHARSD